MKLVLVSALLMFAFTLIAQPTPSTLRNYRAVDGLPQSQVTALVEDNNGYLWIGTEGGGLARFDGRNFKVYTTVDGMQSNFVRNLMLDSRGNLWIVHHRGISRFNGFTFTRFVQERGADPALRRIFEFQDTVFFMSAPGFIGKIHNDSVYYWSRPIERRGADKESARIFFARRVGEALVFCIDGKELLVREGKDAHTIPLPGKVEKFLISFYYKDELWMQTGAGTWRVDLNERVVVPELLPVRYEVKYYDAANDVFWTTDGTRLFRERIRDGHATAELVDADISVSVVTGDSEGAIWLGSNGKGLFKYFVQDFDKLNVAGIQHVMTVHRDREGTIWAGTFTNGLWSIKGGKTRQYKWPEGRVKGVMSIAESPSGELYVSTTAGVGRFNRKTDSFAWKRYGGDDKWKPEVLNMQFDAAGGMWLGTLGGGIIYVKDDSITTYSTNDGLKSNVILASAYSSRYNALFASDEFGLNRVTEGKVHPIEMPELDDAAIIGASIYRDSLVMLATAGSGLVFYNPVSHQRTILTRREGLGSDFCYFAAADSGGTIWVGTEKGISRIELDDRLNVSSHLHYDHDNGLVGLETNQNAYFISDTLKLFGLVDGLYRFNDYDYAGARSFKTHLTGIELFYGETPIMDYASGGAGFFYIPRNLSLPHDKNHITFSFNQVNKRYPKAIQFRYFLEGFDRAWSQPSAATEATYGNLPPGKFTFRVMSTDVNGNWSDEELLYSFVVQAPFYARTGFIIGAILLAAALLTAVLYWRFRSRVSRMLMLERVRLAEQDKVRKDIARDFHDEMGNQLTRIIHYVSLLRMNGMAKVPVDLPEVYAKVEQSAKYLYNGTRDFIWSIDPSNDEVCQLFLHIRDFGEKLFEEKNMNFRTTKSIRNTVKLPYGFSREANLIFKEAMTNAFKYSQAENVSLVMTSENGEIRMLLEDDGVGFNPENCSGGSCLGLKNMNDRARKINATLNIVAWPGSGTRISLHFTIK